MAKVKGLPLGTFLKRFSSEAQCQEYLASLRWQAGYVCPKCGGRHGHRLSNGRPMPSSDLGDGGDSAAQDP